LYREIPKHDSLGRLTFGFLAVLLLLIQLGCGGAPKSIHDIRALKPSRDIVGVWYTVVAGDTVAVLAKRHGVPHDDIVELNGIENPDKLRVGRPIFLFGVDELVKRVRKKTRAKKRQRKGRRRAGVPPLVWPVRGAVLSSGFGPRGRRKHKGIDLAHKPRVSIYAAASGVVVYSNNKQRGYGNLVIIKHPNDVLTVYAHNRRNLVDEGQHVVQGARIAELGNTGRSSGPHLHFELRVRGRAVDPLEYLPAK
jgi:murein DD-endopeptidase MepM/ murein hydrolase activator NlpD